MAEYLCMRAVEFDKLPAKFKKEHGSVQALVDKGYWVQHKYDGCMGIAEVWPEHLGRSRMLSRTGEGYTKSCGHILDALKRALNNAPRCRVPVFVIGEVWQPIEEAAFPEVSGKFRRHSPSPELKFVVNDILPIGMNTSTPYKQRYHDIGAFFYEDPDDIIRVATTYTPSSPSVPQTNVEGWALHLQGLGGYDGAIVRNPDAGYTVGTVKNGEIIKVKPTMSLDLRVITTNQTFGEKTGRPVFTHVVEYKGVQSEVGSGVPHDIRKVAMAGDIVEIECLGITADGKLREPRFKGVRFDKIKPD